MVYFAEMVFGSFKGQSIHPLRFVKIGSSINTKERFGELARMYQCKINLLLLLPGGFQEERAYQRRFAHLRLQKAKTSTGGSHTEFFYPTVELESFIESQKILSVGT